MAYPTISAPYGLLPVNRVDGLPYSGATRSLPIGSGNGTAIFYGDTVKLVSGLVVKDVATDSATPIGTFLGCSFTDPNTLQKTFKQYYPASTVAADIVAVVCDDPWVVMKAAVLTAGSTTVGGFAVSGIIGDNVALVQNTGSTITGNSANGVSTTGNSPSATSLPLRVVGGVEETKNASGSYTEVLVMWNFGFHRYLNSTGGS